jgi:hypothetical protein
MFRFVGFMLALSFCADLMAAPISPGNYIALPPETREGMSVAKLKATISAQEKIQSRRPQIIVLPFKVDAVPEVKAQSGAIKGQNALKEELIRGGAQVIDRGLTAKVKDELAYIESTGTSRGVSFNLADYMFSSEVLNANQGVKYTEAKRVPLQDGGSKLIPAQCTITGSATISISFFTMNPMELKRSLVLEGSASNVIKNISASSCDWKTYRSQYYKQRDYRGLLVQAVQNAINKNDAKIQDMFAPIGYVVDRRYDSKKGKPEKGKGMIFKTTLPNKISTVPNTRITVFKSVVKEDFMSGKKMLEKAEVGTGKVLEVVGDNSIWVKMDKNSSALEVRLGDVVEVINDRKCKWNDVKCHANSLNKKK